MTAAVFAPASTSWALVERAQSGDKDAFADIYRTYQPMIAGWIYMRTSNADLTKDLTADVFVKALSGIGTVSWRGQDFGAWLRTVARNRVADHYRSARYRLEVVTADIRENGEREDSSPEGSPESTAVGHVINATARADLLEALHRLTPDQRQVIILRFFNGMSTRETAAAMGKTEGSVKELLKRATRALRHDESVVALAGAA